MNLKSKVLLIIVSLLAAYAFGRWSAPEKVVTVEAEKKTEDKNQDQHKNVIITEVIAPDGTKKTITHITQDTKTEDKKTDDTSKTSETTYATPKVTLSALGGVSFSSTIPSVVYGASLQKPILGPIGVNLWGLSNRTLGSGISLTF